MCVCACSGHRLFATPWTVAHQAPLSMEFYRQEYWSWLPIPTPGDLLTPGIEPESLMHWQADSLTLSKLGTPNNLCKRVFFRDTDGNLKWWVREIQQLADNKQCKNKREAGFSSVQFSRSVVSDSLQPHETQHARLPCPSLTPKACSNSCPSNQ